MRLESALDQAIANVDLSVMVMGPAPSESESPEGEAARLRAGVLRACRTYGASVYPEHSDLVAVAAKKLGPDHDLCTYEFHLAKQCDLLVIIPSSPGSFCELGYFGMLDALCTKMLILCDGRFPKSGTYVADGPIKAAEQKRARIHYVDYSQPATGISIVEDELRRLRARKTVLEVE